MKTKKEAVKKAVNSKKLVVKIQFNKKQLTNFSKFVKGMVGQDFFGIKITKELCIKVIKEAGAFNFSPMPCIPPAGVALRMLTKNVK